MKLVWPGVAAVVLTTGCASGGSLSSFRGAPFPVMLGPHNRVAPAAQVPTRKVDDWYGEAVNYLGQIDAPTYRLQITHRALSSFMSSRATLYLLEHARFDDADMQVTTLKASAYVTAFGGAAKEIMLVETDIVRPASASGK